MIRNKLFRILTAYALLSGPSICQGQEADSLMPNVADAWVRKFGDMYYLTGTPCPGDWEMQWVGLWKSRDLVNWSGPMLMFEGEVRDRPMWASEIHRKGDDYYIITTCAAWNPGNTFVVMKAPAQEGPYTFHSFLPKKGLDPSIFVDTDGRSYLLDSEWIAPLDDDWTRITSDFVGHRDNKEGPFLIKSNNEYQRYYARIDDTYFMEMEKSTGDTPYSDCYEECGVVLDGKFLPGHGCITVSPDGSELWYASHVTTGGWETRTLGLAPMEFDADGQPVKSTRDLSSQRIPSRNVACNLAKGRPANASGFKAGCLPSYAVDGVKGSFWTPGEEGLSSDSLYLEIDLLGEFDLEKVVARDPKGKKLGCKVMVSCDRINWNEMGKGRNEAAYVRLKDFSSSSPEVGEVEIFRKNYHMPQRDALVATLDASNMEEFNVPTTGIFDIEYTVQSASNDSSWNLYDNGNLIATEKVASTGPDGKRSRIISFGIPLSANRSHQFRIVPCGGDFSIGTISVYSLK